MFEKAHLQEAGWVYVCNCSMLFLEGVESGGGKSDHVASSQLSRKLVASNSLNIFPGKEGGRGYATRKSHF